MRYVEFRQRIYALDKGDVAEDVGTPDELLAELHRHSSPNRVHGLKCCDFKDCDRCEEYIEDECNYCADQTCVADRCYCYGFTPKRE